MVRRAPALAAVAGPVLALLAACAPLSRRASRPPEPGEQLKHDIAVPLLKNRPVAAREALAAALRAQPRRGGLHLLNGLTYEMEDGSAESLGLAKVGYDAAVKFDPGQFWPQYLAGSAAFDLRDYPEASERFAGAILVNPDRPEGFLGLAMAEYYGGNLKLARAASDRALALAPNDPLAFRTAAFVRAAEGEHAGLTALLRRAEANPAAAAELAPQRERLARVVRVAALDRVTQIAVAQPPAPAAAPAQPAALGASPAETTAPGASPVETPAPGASPVETPAPGAITEPDPTPAASAPPPQPAAHPVAKPAEGKVGELGPVGPLIGLLNGPQQLMIEVTLLLSQSTMNHSVGINLLDGLTAQFGLGQANTSSNIDGEPDTTSRVITRAIKVPDITYNLNVFNTKHDNYRVIARPSLVASLGKESEFFIGRTITIGISGVNLGSLAPVDIGVTVKVIPIELTPEHAKFRVGIIRSFLDDNSAGTFDQSLTTFQQSVEATAQVDFGKTLILSGLYEGVDRGTSSEVPGLGDIPILSFFFKAKARLERRDVALVLVTPRMAGSIPTDTREIRGETLDRLLTVWKDLVDPASNMDTIVDGLGQRESQIRSCAPNETDLRPPPRSGSMLEEIVGDTVAQLL